MSSMKVSAPVVKITLGRHSERWNEHDHPNGNSEPSKHITNHPDHLFTWKVICNASRFNSKRKILEAYIIMIKQPTLNNKLELPSINLFRNGIT